MAAPLRVLIAHNRYQQRGGEDMVVEAEAALLRQHGHPVDCMWRDNHDVAGMSRWRLAGETLWSARSGREFAERVVAFRPDILHVHNSFPLISPSLYWAAASRGTPVVQTLHNFRLMCPQAMFLRSGRVCEDCQGRPPWRGVVHRCYRHSVAQSAVVAAMLSTHRCLGTYRSKVTRYIALNEFCRRKFVEGGLPGERISVKPNFVDIEDGPQAERAGGLFVGRLAEDKGIEVLAEAVQIAATQVTVVGAGPMQERIRGSDGIGLTGLLAHDEIADRMRRSSYLVMPSLWYENFPRTLVEAFACGLPVIASRLGALAELVDDGCTGLLFEPGSAADLARAIRWAEEHPQEMRRMGRLARAEYEAKYTPEKNYELLMAIYGDAIAAASRERAGP